MNEALAQAYQQALYTVRLRHLTLQLRVGLAQPGIDRQLRLAGCHRHWCLLTACNPDSRPLRASLNRHRQRRLRAELLARGWRFLPACGSAADGSWREESFLLLDAPLATVTQLARRYRQLAYLYGRLQQAPQLRWR